MNLGYSFQSLDTLIALRREKNPFIFFNTENGDRIKDLKRNMFYTWTVLFINETSSRYHYTFLKKKWGEVEVFCFNFCKNGGSEVNTLSEN